MRRQTGGFMPRSVTFRLTTLFVALLFGSVVLLMIPPPSCRLDIAQAAADRTGAFAEH
jgi:hypothetical protein